MFDPSEDPFYLKDFDSIIDLILNLLEDVDEADVLTFLSYSTGLKFKRTTNVSGLLLNLLLFVPDYMLLNKHKHLPGAALPFLDVEDIVRILTDSVNPKDYIKKLRKRDLELSEGWGQIVTPLKMQTAGGMQKVNCADVEGIFRIIRSIPSKKAEPIKQWLAKVGQERVQEMADPSKAIDIAYLVDNNSTFICKTGK